MRAPRRARRPRVRAPCCRSPSASVGSGPTGPALNWAGGVAGCRRGRVGGRRHSAARAARRCCLDARQRRRRRRRSGDEPLQRCTAASCCTPPSPPLMQPPASGDSESGGVRVAASGRTAEAAGVDAASLLPSPAPAWPERWPLEWRCCRRQELEGVLLSTLTWTAGPLPLCNIRPLRMPMGATGFAGSRNSKVRIK
jgi:hypothetical protein